MTMVGVKLSLSLFFLPKGCCVSYQLQRSITTSCASVGLPLKDPGGVALSQTSWWAPYTDGVQIWSLWGPCKPSPLGGQHMHSLSSTLQAPENAPVTGSASHFGEMPSSCPLQQSPPSPQQRPGPGSPTDLPLWEGPLASSGSFLRRA